MNAVDLTEASNKKLAVGLAAIFLGAFGVHKFMLGYTKAGLIMLMVSLLTWGIGGFVMGVIGVVEGILYVSKTPQEFSDMYQQGVREWF